MKESKSDKAPIRGSMAFTELASEDPRATIKFLDEAFGWKFDPVKFPLGEYFTHQGEGGTMVGVRPAQAREIPVTMNYVRVNDLEKAIERVRSLNAEIVLPRTDIPKMGSFFWFRIPRGPIMACWQDAPK